MLELTTLETLLSRHRIHPISPPPGPFPYITHITTPSTTPTSSINHSKPVRHLAFARPPPSGEFTDFTARYGALQEDDKLSFRQTLSALDPAPMQEAIEDVARVMQIHHLLDLPSVSLSSGQTRRARIAAALLTKPILLLLEDPMSGLDVKSRDQVSAILGDINARCDPRIVLVLRGKGGSLPDWVTDVCEVRSGDVWIGSRKEWEERGTAQAVHARIEEEQVLASRKGSREATDPVVQLSDVSVSYGEGTRKVGFSC